jgi:hypothetical protein
MAITGSLMRFRPIRPAGRQATLASEPVDFRRSERADRPDGQPAELDTAHARPDQSFDWMTYRGKHPPRLSLPPLLQH